MISLISDSNPGKARFYRRAVACCAMLAAAMVYRSDCLTDWDSWSYAGLAVTQHSSYLLLGRWWFIATMRAAYLAGSALGVGPLEAYLVMQAVCSLMMAAALWVAMAWVYRLTRSAAAEVLLAVLVVPGPLYGIYASAVMTEGMTLLMLTLAFWAWEKAIAGGRPATWAALAGAAMGVAIDIREPALLLAAWPIVSCFIDKPARPWRLLTTAAAGAVVTLGIGIYGGYAWHDPPSAYFAKIAAWSSDMAAEEQKFHQPILALLWSNVVCMVKYSCACSPVVAILALPLIAAAIVRAFSRDPSGSDENTASEDVRITNDTNLAEPNLKGTSHVSLSNCNGSRCRVSALPVGSRLNGTSHASRRLLWLAAATLPYVCWMLLNHDLCVNPRYPMPLVWILAAVTAGLVDTAVVGQRARYRLRLATAAGVLLALSAGIVAAAWDKGAGTYFRFAQSQQQVYTAMLDLPDNSVVIAGPGTMTAAYLRQVGGKDFRIIPSGWKWPGEQLPQAVQAYLDQGRPVYANLDGANWEPAARDAGEWVTLRRLVLSMEIKDVRWPMVRLEPKKPVAGGQ